MAGLVPAIHVFLVRCIKNVDARHEAGHDEFRQQVCRRLAAPARIAKRYRQTKGGSQDAAASGKLARKTITSFRSDANGSRECAPDDRLRIEPGIWRFPGAQLRI
jgi:hypothetical protein